MKWFSISIAASLAGFVIVSSSALADGNARLARTDKKMNRAPASLSRQAVQHRQAQPPQQARSRAAKNVTRQHTSLQHRPTRTSGQATKMGRLGKKTGSTRGYTSTLRNSRQGATARLQPTPADKFLRPRPTGKLTVRPTTPTGRIRAQQRGLTELSPQPEPPDQPVAARSRVGNGKRLLGRSRADLVRVGNGARGVKPSSIVPRGSTLKPPKKGKAAAERTLGKKRGSPLKNTGSKKSDPGKTASKPLFKGSAEPSGSRGEPVPKGTVVTDEEGNEYFEGTVDEQMAVANGGTYEWTDAEGNEHVTTVTPDGTTRDYVSADGSMASTGYAPHDRREEIPPADGGGVDGGSGVVRHVLDYVLPFVPGIGHFGGGYYGNGYGAPGYYDPGYYDHGYPDYVAATTSVDVLAGDSWLGSPAAGAELIPETAAGASDQGQMRFTRRLLHVANATDKAITVYVQFRGRLDDGGWAWLPTDPATSQEALTFQVAAGQAGYLEHDGAPISASRVRIWAESGSRQWSGYENEDLWLVSEVDSSGQRAYFAADMQAFPFTFE